MMKSLLFTIFSWVVLCFFVIGCFSLENAVDNLDGKAKTQQNPTNPAIIDVVPNTPAEVDISVGVLTSPPPAVSELTLDSCGFPSLLHFGDTFYCRVLRKNETDRDMSVLKNNPRFTLTAEGVDESYTWISERCTRPGTVRAVGGHRLHSGDAKMDAYPLECPPLEDMELPFWKKIQEKMWYQEVKCTLTVSFDFRYANSDTRMAQLVLDKTEIPAKLTPEETVEVLEKWREMRDSLRIIHTHELLLKPRPGDEMELLWSWYRDTPEWLRPPASKDWLDARRLPDGTLQPMEEIGWRNSAGRWITIRSGQYNPWCFIRPGNRKPPPHLCPTDAAGWRKLEESLALSTMQDEIRFTRMLIEYLDTQEEKKQGKKREEIVGWLESLPEPQGIGMAYNLESIYSNATHYAYKHDLYRAPDLQQALRKLRDRLSRQ